MSPVIDIHFDHKDAQLLVVEGKGTYAAREVLRKLQDAAEQPAVALAGSVHVQMIPAGESWLQALHHDGHEWRRAITFI